MDPSTRDHMTLLTCEHELGGGQVLRTHRLHHDVAVCVRYKSHNAMHVWQVT